VTAAAPVVQPVAAVQHASGIACGRRAPDDSCASPNVGTLSSVR
jgi:hypothetical protein